MVKILKNIRSIELCLYSVQNNIISLKGISNILPLNSDNRLRIIRVAKYSAYLDSRFLEMRNPKKRDPKKAEAEP